MNPIERIAEARIQSAIEAGELENLAAAGKPLDLTDLGSIPPEERAAYRILRNAGLVPEEVTSRRELARVEAALARGARDAELETLRRRRLALELKRNLAADRRLGRL